MCAAYPQLSMNTIESSVTRLLVATKHLLESLTQWARQNATETDVSNAYVQLGGDFKVACRAFSSAGVDVTDLGDVPHSLRVVLEEALCEPPSQQSLDKYLPTIRQIIVTLLRNLKRKQSEIRGMGSGAVAGSGPLSSAVHRASSTPVNHHRRSHHGHQRHQLQQLQQQADSRQQPHATDRVPLKHGLPPQHKSEPLPKQRLDSYRALSEGAAGHPPSTKLSASSSTLGKPINEIPNIRMEQSPEKQQTVPPPQIPPQAPALSAEESDALKQLQNGDSLKRRASRRFSAYQYAKLTKQAEMPLPKGINEFKKDGESPTLSGSVSIPKNVSLSSMPVAGAPAPLATEPSTAAGDGILQVINDNSGDGDGSSRSSSSSSATNPVAAGGTRALDAVPGSKSTSVFLKINNRTKKVNITFPVSFNSLRLLFIEKFAYSPGADSFPEIYIQETVADVPYELEEHLLTDIKEGTIISLNAQDRGSIELIKNLETQMSSLQSQMLQFQDTIKETIVEALANGTSSSPSNRGNSNTKAGSVPRADSSGNIKSIDRGNTLGNTDVSDMRHELSVVKQISADSKKDFTTTIESLLAKVEEFKNSGFDASRSANRNYMETCHNKLSEDSDDLLTKVDDLQDVVEALRKDVAQRGARPSDKQLVTVKHDIDAARTAINVMHKYIVTEKPNWKTIWEKELDIVCEEQQFFKLQEDLVDDLKEDLAKALETFTLVEHVSQEHQKNSGKFRQPNLPLVEPGQSMTGLRDAMLSEVQALQPNHQNRLDAIEKAEKLREKERQARMKNQFEEELGGFVEGKMLKKSGGIEETERVRKMKDEQNLKSSFTVF